MDLPLTTPRNELFRGTGRGLVEAKDLGRFGYIAIYSMVDGVVEQFDQALKGLVMKDGIIIDLRNNGGGNSANGDQIMRRLVQKSTPGWNRAAHPHKELNYAGPVVALVSNYTFSAAESFAFDLFDSGRVTVMGEPTGGDSGGGPQRFVTDGGIQFRIPTRGLDHSASGLPMEGVGLKPHIAVSQLYADFLAGKDTALEAAKAKLMELAGQKP
ncbi:MAG: S41 family peptidase, partial [Bacillota bacterium]